MRLITWSKTIELLNGEYVETGISIPVGIISMVDCAVRGIESEVRAKILKSEFVSAYTSPYRIEELQIVPAPDGTFDLLFNLDNFNLQIRE